MKRQKAEYRLCFECRHWKREGHGSFGACDRLSLRGNTDLEHRRDRLAYTFSVLFTGGGFGCPHWEQERPEAE